MSRSDIEMSRKTASGQASEAILRFSASAHNGSQKIRDETKKWPRSNCAWTLCKNRRPLLARDDLPADLYARWRDSGDKKLGHENCSCRAAGDLSSREPNVELQLFLRLSAIKRALSSSLPRASRDITVPIGISSALAISL